jgi:hypothetical protein
VATNRQYRSRGAQGYALPSVLFLLTILSVVSFSILLLIYSRRQLALREVAKVKADYAAQNAIALLLNGWKGIGIAATQQQYSFEDGTTATATLTPWGFMGLVQSTGRSGRHVETRTAIIGAIPGETFKNALVFTHPSHQLVFAGSSRVVGNVLTGPQGVSTGSLPGAISPRTIPVEGRVIRALNLPIRRTSDEAEDELNKFIQKTIQNPSAFRLDDPSGLGTIADSVVVVRVPPGSIIRAKIVRRREPLYVLSEGELTIASEAQLSGLVAFMSARDITVRKGSQLEHSILWARRAISVEAGADVTVQCIAPEIVIGDGASLRYPSVIGSYSTDPTVSPKGVRLGTDCRVEGSIVVVSGTSAEEPRAQASVPNGAVVIGAIVNDLATDLRGRIVGTLITRDFFFYEAPTTYLGWLRGGQIDRRSLPQGFLLPMMVSDHSGLQVLDWP